ncbi:MAG: threonylcarbamoyl-AMP synthase [Bacteroidetes bacterium]|nr:threonylcarbamoyl-AMP synthase [Bacteroidota bacterium]
MLIKIYPQNPAPRHVSLVVDVLRKGGLIIYPTDSVYAIGCDMLNQDAIDRLCQVINKKPEQANLSLICSDLKNLSEYSLPISNSVYKLMKSSLPGAYTFILKANNKVPKLFKNKKKEIGIRVPDNNIPRDIVKELGNPIVTASIKMKDEFSEYPTDPELIYDEYKHLVDLVIDGGRGATEHSTVLDCTGEDVVLIREGKGEVALAE